MNGGSAKIVRWRLRCFGRVQRVGFRFAAFCLARELSLTGWADNREDGSVELEVQGRLCALRQFVIRIKSREHIRIDRLELLTITTVPSEHGFKIRGD